MKYICLGYLELGKFENMPESERNTVLDECFSYNDDLRKNGHLVAEEPLQPANTAVTVSWKLGVGRSGWPAMTRMLSVTVPSSTSSSDPPGTLTHR